ncbi:hypothetical protein Q1W73_13605 [Asticcacaulis sp. ZE23SCel15]|uniref:EF-hand domain-containing protein n=1 Tax=Asticcacaulis sp. ZE23SCel15 TaxID=3059027 RepID=UPI00265EB408|nr:EF-hand domain-containing protein [Asticcacaulis sp. ZE23SCel15]WKL56696.1 hypothetical protein Q1W73_13605 [Asticcacaulis sp. ZE23SCel15]
MTRTSLLIAGALSLTVPSLAQAAPRFEADQIKRAVQEMSKADINGDGMITRAEFSVWRGAQFDRMDRNSDGYVSEKDARLGRKAKDRLAQALSIYDTNRDGRISRTEFAQGPTRGFDQLDRDSNGVIDGYELKQGKRG